MLPNLLKVLHLWVLLLALQEKHIHTYTSIFNNIKWGLIQENSCIFWHFAFY